MLTEYLVYDSDALRDAILACDYSNPTSNSTSMQRALEARPSLLGAVTMRSASIVDAAVREEPKLLGKFMDADSSLLRRSLSERPALLLTIMQQIIGEDPQHLGNLLSKTKTLFESIVSQDRHT